MRPFKECLIDQLAFPTAAELSTEAAENEYEIEGYLKGYDIDEIKAMALSHCGQEQWGIFVPKTPANASSGSTRVRKNIAESGEITYEFTTKLAGDLKGRPESNLPSDADQFELFKHLADQGLVKTRYLVPHEVNGVKFTFEVDVFYNTRGELVPWLKIDAELPEGMELSVQDFPFKRDEIIVISPKIKADNLNNVMGKVQDLYEKYFRSENAIINAVTPVEEEAA